MKKIVPVIACLFSLVGVAYAADGQTSAQVFLAHVVDILFAVLTAAASWAAVKAAAWFRSKTGLEMEGLATQYAQKAIDFAKEKSHQASQEFGAKLKGPEKLEEAIAFFLKLAEDNNLPKKVQDKAVLYIESVLGATRKK